MASDSQTVVKNLSEMGQTNDTKQPSQILFTLDIPRFRSRLSLAQICNNDLLSLIDYVRVADIIVLTVKYTLNLDELITEVRLLLVSRNSSTYFLLECQAGNYLYESSRCTTISLRGPNGRPMYEVSVARFGEVFL